jgi:hypothetical protein
MQGFAFSKTPAFYFFDMGNAKGVGAKLKKADSGNEVYREITKSLFIGKANNSKVTSKR